MKRAMRVQAMGKKLTLITAAFVLTVSTLMASLPFILSQQVGAVTGTTVDGVSTYQDLKNALEDPTVGYINLASKITIQAPEKLVLTRSDIRVNGNDSTIRYTGANPAGWQGLYVLQAYKVKNVQINSLRLAGGDAGMLINGSEVILKGNTHPLNDNEFGGIEVSRGLGATDNSILKLEGNVWDESFNEVNGKPVVWVLNGQGQVDQSALNSKLTAATHIKSDQTQYYLRPANANIVATNVSNGETFASLPAALTDSDTANGHIVEVKSSTITQPTTINKSVTIRGVNNAVITTSGSAKLFTVLADGVVFENLTLNKTDNVDQNIIGVQSDNVTIQNSRFSAQYNLQANLGTTRVVEVSGGVDNLTISGNTFNNIRQPAYLNNSAKGTISNNYVNNTRGWVVENNTDFTFTGNSWGVNAVDIALIKGSNPTLVNNYTCRLAAIIYTNNNARVDDQAPAQSCSDTVAPQFAIESPANGSTVSGTQTISARITDASGIKKVLMTVPTKNGSSTYTWELGKTNNSLSRVGDVFSVVVDTATMNDGQTHVVLRATDGANNTRYWNNNAATRQHMFIVDNAGPTAPVITSPAQSQEFNSSVRSITATWSPSADPAGVKQYEISYEYTRNGTRVTDTRLVSGISRTQNLNGSTLSDFIIKVRAQDNQGNWGQWSAPVTYYYGVSAPGSSTDTPPTPADPSNGGTQPGQTDGANSSSNSTTSQNNNAFAVTGAPGAPAQAPAGPGNTAQVLGDSTVQDDSESEDTPTGTPEIKGASTEGSLASAIDSDNTDGNGTGLAWYWWLLIVAAIALIGWWIISALRNRSEV